MVQELDIANNYFCIYEKNRFAPFFLGHPVFPVSRIFQRGWETFLMFDIGELPNRTTIVISNRYSGILVMIENVVRQSRVGNRKKR